MGERPTPEPQMLWMLSSTTLLNLLRRAHAGEDPDQLLLGEYANANHSTGLLMRGMTVEGGE